MSSLEAISGEYQAILYLDKLTLLVQLPMEETGHDSPTVTTSQPETRSGRMKLCTESKE